MSVASTWFASDDADSCGFTVDGSAGARGSSVHAAASTAALTTNNALSDFDAAVIMFNLLVCDRCRVALLCHLIKLKNPTNWIITRGDCFRSWLSAVCNGKSTTLANVRGDV